MGCLSSMTFSKAARPRRYSTWTALVPCCLLAILLLQEPVLKAAAVLKQQQIKKGSVLNKVSDPAAPGNLWQLEPRSNLRHVLDQFRMQQSATVTLEVLPPSAAEGEAQGRTGFDKGHADCRIMLSSQISPEAQASAIGVPATPAKAVWTSQGACRQLLRRTCPHYMHRGGAGAEGSQKQQWNQRIDQGTMARRQEQREAYLSKPGTRLKLACETSRHAGWDHMYEQSYWASQCWHTGLP
ncbi:hypothetical protein MMC07_005696 [Pseudocyphellaria aurata]|nr:hypothetical protein [Pseudocyphellaria aurata]